MDDKKLSTAVKSSRDEEEPLRNASGDKRPCSPEFQRLEHPIEDDSSVQLYRVSVIGTISTPAF